MTRLAGAGRIWKPDPGRATPEPVLERGITDVPEQSPAISAWREQGPQRWVAVIGLGVLLGWAITYFSWPLSRDQNLFLWVADTIVRGGLPYHNAFEIKGPLAYYIVAAYRSLLGGTEWGYRLLDLCFQSGVLLSLASIYRGRAGSAGRLTGGLAFALWYASQDINVTGQPDGWACALCMGALAVLLAPGRRMAARRAALSGAMVGLATMIKPTYAAFLVMPVMWVVWTEDLGPKHLGSLGLAILASWITPIAIAVAWFAWHGALRAAIDVHLLYTASVYAGEPLLAFASALIDWADARHLPQFMLGAPFAVMGLIELGRRDRRAAVTVASGGAAAVMGLVAQGTYWSYLWLPFLPFLALLAGFGVDAIDRLANARTGWTGLLPGAFSSRSLLLASQILLLGSAAVTPILEVGRGARYLSGRQSRAGYYAHFQYEEQAEPETAAVASYLRSHTKSWEPIQVWGMAAAIYVQSQRWPPTRFGTSQGLVAGGDNAWRRRYRTEFLTAFKRALPAYVVESNAAKCALAPGETKYCLRSFPELQAVVAARYELDRDVGEFTLYRRR